MGILDQRITLTPEHVTVSKMPKLHLMLIQELKFVDAATVSTWSPMEKLDHVLQELFYRLLQSVIVSQQLSHGMMLFLIQAQELV